MGDFVDEEPEQKDRKEDALAKPRPFPPGWWGRREDCFAHKAAMKVQGTPAVECIAFKGCAEGRSFRSSMRMRSVL